MNHLSIAHEIADKIERYKAQHSHFLNNHIMVYAKFKCQSVTDFGNQKLVTLTPVTGPGNESFSKFTPSGKLELTITNPEAFNQFFPQEDYFLTISPANDLAAANRTPDATMNRPLVNQDPRGRQ